MSYSTSRRGKNPWLKKLRTHAKPVAASVLALAVAGTVLSSPYNRTYDIETSIDSLVAPGAATLVGHYAAFEEVRVGLTEGGRQVRDEVTARYRQILDAGHSGEIFEQLDEYVQKGYETAKDGHVSTMEAMYFGATILHADRRLKTYAEETKSSLEAHGFETKGAQKIAAGLIGTELLSKETDEEVTARKYIQKTELDPDVAAFLSRGLTDLEVSIRSVQHATAVRDDAVSRRIAYAQKTKDTAQSSSDGSPGPGRPAKTRALSIQSTQTRPEARPDHLGRSSDIQEHLTDTALTRPEARTARIQEKARYLVALKNSGEGPSRQDPQGNARAASEPEL